MSFVGQVWHANTDFSPVVIFYAVLAYIAEYASMGNHASSFYTDNMNEILQVTREETPARSVIQHSLRSTINERDYSA